MILFNQGSNLLTFSTQLLGAYLLIIHSQQQLPDTWWKPLLWKTDQNKHLEKRNSKETEARKEERRKYNCNEYLRQVRENVTSMEHAGLLYNKQRRKEEPLWCKNITTFIKHLIEKPREILEKYSQKYNKKTEIKNRRENMKKNKLENKEIKHPINKNS